MTVPEPRDAPALVVVVELEGSPRLYVTAQSAEDAARLREDLLGRPALAAELADLVDPATLREIRSRGDAT